MRVDVRVTLSLEVDEANLVHLARSLSEKRV